MKLDAPTSATVVADATAPRITAIVSTYASERFLRGCLDDLVAQTVFPQMEVIVVDACSPQNERGIVEEYQRRYANIRYVRTAERIPLYAAWNLAIRMARGEYLTNANTDDRHAPHALERLARALDEHPGAGVAYASTAITEAENGTLGSAPVKGFFRARKFDRRRLFFDCLPGPQPMWRRSLHERFGFFDEAFRSGGDHEFWLRISAEVKFIHLPEVLGLFLDSPQSISHNTEINLARRNSRATVTGRRNGGRVRVNTVRCSTAWSAAALGAHGGGNGASKGISAASSETDHSCGRIPDGPSNPSPTVADRHLGAPLRTTWFPGGSDRTQTQPLTAQSCGFRSSSPGILCWR